MDPAKRAEIKRRGRSRLRRMRKARRRAEFNARQLRKFPNMSVPQVEYVGFHNGDGVIIEPSKGERLASLNREQKEVRWKQELARRDRN